MKNYLDVTIRILSDSERTATEAGAAGLRPAAYRVLIDSPKGQGESTFEPPFALADLASAVFGVAQTVRAVASINPPASESKVPPNVREWGEKLYEALFKGEIKSILDKTVGAADERQDTGVRVRMAMNLAGQGMAEVASLPWELMRAPKDAAPMVMSNRRLLVRSLDVPQPTEPQPYQPPLRILAVVSNPSGTAPLNLDEERARITRNWALLPGVKVDFARPVRADLLRQLAAADYHVIHYMGHGDYRGGVGGSLLLEREDGSADPISGEELGVYLADELPTLRLVFLNACKTATSIAHSGVDPFAGVATALIRAGVPAVVAMQFPISDQAAISFADTFYQRIAQSFPVDAAVAEARKALYSEERSEWATPVLFLRAKDGVLFKSSTATEVSASAAPASESRSTTTTQVSAAPDDPWGAGAADAFRVFLAAPNERLRPLHRSLSGKLAGAGVRVVGSVPPPYDASEHAAAVKSLVSRADLCVHLLGESPGEPLDEGETLNTYPLEQLRIGLEAAQSQMVLIPDEVDIESLADPQYKAFIQTLIARPRDAGRFELVRAGRHQFADEIRAKLQRLQEARQAASQTTSAGTMGGAFVDAHRSDLQCAQLLENFLVKQNIDVTRKTSSVSAADALSPFDIKLNEYPLYFVVSGSADKAWVESRWKAAMKSAATQDAKALVAVYLAPSGQAGKVSIRYDGVDDSSAKDALIAQFARGLE